MVSLAQTTPKVYHLQILVSECLQWNEILETLVNKNEGRVLLDSYDPSPSPVLL